MVWNVFCYFINVVCIFWGLFSFLQKAHIQTDNLFKERSRKRGNGQGKKDKADKNGINKMLTRMLHGDQSRGQPVSLLTKSSSARTAPTGAGLSGLWESTPVLGWASRSWSPSQAKIEGSAGRAQTPGPWQSCPSITRTDTHPCQML